MSDLELDIPLAGESDRLTDLTGEHYLGCLQTLHEILEPRTYFEVGTFRGTSLKLARCAAIAVDPQFKLDGPLPGGSIPALCLFQMTSDTFFASHDPRSILGAPIDLAFLDGRHVFEYLLRDFIHTERVSQKQSVIALHDCVPLDLHMAARDVNDMKRRNLSVHPDWWTGDVWKILPVLRKYRPDLEVEVFNAPPTGLVVIHRLDPDSRVLTEHYEQIIKEFREPADEAALFSGFLRGLEISDTSRLGGPGSFAWAKRSIAKLLAVHPPRDFFREGSQLREGLLRLASLEDIVEPLRRALAGLRDHAGVALLQQESAAQGSPFKAAEDLALCKPAMASSVSRWSSFQNPEQDACGANSELLADDYGFFTREETMPWWRVDLLDEYLIHEIVLVNRRTQAQRFRTFRIETSCDARVWTTRFTQSDPDDVSSDPAWPWRVRFEDPVPARYVRIVLLGRGMLDLRRVQVFGRAARNVSSGDLDLRNGFSSEPGAGFLG